VLCPKVGGFGNAHVMKMGDAEIVRACVQVFNNWITDWTSADPND